MPQTTLQSDFWTKINKIVHFFARTSKGGFLFCSCDRTPVMKQIVKIVIGQAAQENMNIIVLNLLSDDSQDFPGKIKSAAEEKPGGIIISSLDESIALTGDQIIKNINLARDILLEFKLPFLFCASKENISKFANQAQDLFSRRERGVIHFTGIPGQIEPGQGNEFHALEYREQADSKRLALKIDLLEGQLREAQEKKYDSMRIANEIALDLIDVYLDAGFADQADELFARYKAYFNMDDHLKAIDIAAKLYLRNSQWDKALEYCLKSRAINDAHENSFALAGVLADIGLIFRNKGEWEKAMEYYFASKEIFGAAGVPGRVAAVLNDIGSTHANRGEWGKALEYYVKSKEMFEKAGDDTGQKTVAKNITTIKERTVKLDF